MLARARSWFEVKLVLVCETTGIPYPELGVKVAGTLADAVWADEMVIVECDGEGNHGTWGQRKRDIGNDYKFRRLGFMPIRYTYDQLEDPWAIHADLMPILEERRGWAAKRRAA
jgi:very-short-patch-repair endonuclease